MAKGKTMVFCPQCKLLADIHAPFHTCTVYTKDWQVVSRTRRVWNSKLSCFDLAPGEKEPELEDVRKGNRYYDSKLNKWIELSTGQPVNGAREIKRLGPGDPGDEDKSEPQFSSCEIGPKKQEKEKEEKTIPERPVNLRSHSDQCSCWNCWNWKKSTGQTDKNWSDYTGYSYGSHGTYGYVDVKPWDGVEYKKWPNTYFFLLRYFYVGNDWYSGGKYISAKEYQDRILHGKYVKEEKKEVVTIQRPTEKYTTDFVDDDEDEEAFWYRWSNHGDA